MNMTFRWYGDDDQVPLGHIRQIPGVSGIVTALHHIPTGQVWPSAEIEKRKRLINGADLSWEVVESVSVHEDIKLGLPSRDDLIANYIKTLRNLGKAGIKVVTYNFMPVFDWTRSDLAKPLADGSTTLAYETDAVVRMNPLQQELSLPGWDESYTPEELESLMEAYQAISPDNLWENLAYFLKAVVPAAEESGLRLAIHPDDPPWPIFGLPRIITDDQALERLLKLVESPANGLCLCTGSLGASSENDLPAMIRKHGKRIHFVHMRNVMQTGEHGFHETAHLSAAGSLDMFEVMQAFFDTGFAGYIRPDHGRMIWNETGRPGYGLFDRALGAAYLSGLWEAVTKTGSASR